MFVSTEEQNSDWSQYALVLPAVSVGNVGQLAADLVISSLGFRKIGYFHDDTFLPVIGNDPFASSKDANKCCCLMTAAEVYEEREKKIVAIQQRSPIIKGKKSQYVDKLLDWVKQCSFQQIILLTSSFAHERRDSQLTGTQLRYLLTDSLQKTAGSTLEEQLGWKVLEPRKAYPSEQGELFHNNADEVFIPGGGIAKMMFHKCQTLGLPLAVLLLFCSEGDNALDAIQVASYLNAWKGWIDTNTANKSTVQPSSTWRVPSSWKLQYGSRFDQSLFW